MIYTAWMALGVAIGAVMGYVIGEEGDLEAVLFGGIAGWFAISFLYDKAGKLKAFNAWRVPALLLGLAALAIGGWFAKDAFLDEAGFVWRDAAVELRPVVALKGIALGQPLRDVIARVGAFEPDEAAGNRDGSSGVRNYVQRESRIRLLVADDRVSRVSYECGAFGDFTQVNRVGCNSKESRVIEVFGGGARRMCAKVAASDPRAALARNAFAFDALETGTRYIALEGRVRGFIVMAPPDLEEALGGDQPWRRCE